MKRNASLLGGARQLQARVSQRPLLSDVRKGQGRSKYQEHLDKFRAPAINDSIRRANELPYLGLVPLRHYAA